MDRPNGTSSRVQITLFGDYDNKMQDSKVSKSLLSANLSENSMNKLAWYFNLPVAEVDQHFVSLPQVDECSTIVKFSKFTRCQAGEDPEAPPDDVEDERRIRETHESLLSAAATAFQERSSSRKKRRVINYPVVEVGRKVAARLDDEWMLMTVIKYSRKFKVYTLQDADDMAESKEEHEVSRDWVIPVASPEYTPPCFPMGSRVLAVFPGTTSFYPATVVRPTKRGGQAGASRSSGARATWDYSLQFDEDEEDDDGEVVVKRVKGELVIEEACI